MQGYEEIILLLHTSYILQASLGRNTHVYRSIIQHAN